MGKNERSSDLIRAMKTEDIDSVLEWRNHPDTRRFMFTQREISVAEHREWFAAASVDPGKHLLIVELGGTPAGFVQFKEIGCAQVGDWGFYAAPDAPKGTGKKLGNLALGHAFALLGFHKMCGQVLADNTPSVNYHRSLGFTEEGLLRDHYFDGARFHDVICFGLLEDEWRNTAAR